MTDSRQPTLAEVLEAVMRARLAELFTALPGVVESYDKAKQKANVRIAIKDRLELADGEEVADYPVIPNVPVVHPSGGGFVAAFPLKAGDPVLLVFSARSIDVWKSSGPTSASAAAVDPNDFRMHDFADAYAIPGGRPLSAPFTEASDEDLVIGKDGGTIARLTAAGVWEFGTSNGAKEFIAQAQKTLTELTNIVNAFNSHIHTTTATIGPSAVPGVIAPPTVAMAAPGSVAASKGKVE